MRPPASVDQQRTGTDVPGVRRVGLEEGVDTTRRDVGEAERRRAETANGAAAVGEGDDALPELADRRGAVALHAGAHQRLLERCSRRHLQPLTAEPGASAAGRREQLVAERLEDRPGDEAGIVADGHRGACHRHAVGVVRGSVERIDEPRELATLDPAATLLAEDRVLRVVAADHPHHLVLGGDVDRGHQRRAFVLVGDVDRSVAPLDEHDAGGASRSRGDREQGCGRRRMLASVAPRCGCHARLRYDGAAGRCGHRVRFWQDFSSVRQEPQPLRVAGAIVFSLLFLVVPYANTSLTPRLLPPCPAKTPSCAFVRLLHRRCPRAAALARRSRSRHRSHRRQRRRAARGAPRAVMGGLPRRRRRRADRVRPVNPLASKRLAEMVDALLAEAPPSRRATLKSRRAVIAGLM